MKIPTIEEVQAYIDETNVNVDAKVIWHSYNMKGWKLKTGPMKQWHSAVGLWAASGWGKTGMSTRMYQKRNAKPQDAQEARDTYQDYFEGLTPRALQGHIDDASKPGQPTQLTRYVWLMKEALNAKKTPDS